MRPPPVPNGLVKQEPGSSRAGVSTAQQGYQNPEWTNEETKALEASMSRYPAEKHTLMERAVRISATLKNKTARDVALRIMWTQRRDLAKKAKKEASERTAKNNIRRERSGSIFAVQAPAAGAARPSGKSGGAANGADGGKDTGSPAELAQLLDSNFHIIGQIRENMKWFKVNENTELLVRMRDNTIKILQQMSQSNGIMKQMPPLPVKMNLELANNFLPKVLGQAPQLQPQVMLQMAPQVQLSPGGALHAIPAQAMNIPAHLQMHQQAAQAAGFSQALQQQQAMSLKMVHNISTTLGMAVGGGSAPMQIMQMAAAPVPQQRPQ